MRWTGAIAVIVLSAALNGCLFRKKPAPPLQPPPLPSPVQPAPPDPMPVPGVEPPAQEMQTAPAPSVQEPELPPAPQEPAKPATRSGQSPPGPRPAATPDSGPAEAQPAAPKPQLGEVVPSAQRVQLMQEYQTAANEARQALEAASGRSLSEEQSAGLVRIRSFLSQAESLSGGDPRAAAELARRALVLARDLLKSLR
jgi:hypothetical protein